MRDICPDLLLGWFLEAREVNERRETHQTLPARDSDPQPQAVGEQGAVGVAPLREVDNTEQLGEEDDVDQVRTQGPEDRGDLHSSRDIPYHKP